ncbi:pentatricopeptide repeat-containing protein At5g48910-like [Tasmannia lanceolata]|uniref:pentatricopeptide repeat-containing protein At5g48910-like n=1 Tax=Tasmannia lanceolata TaxID=3420 RepID=UPI0040632042
MSVFSNSSLFPPPIPAKIQTCKTIKDLQQLHAQKIKTGRIRDPFAAAQILQFYALSDHPNLQSAHLVFTHMEEPNCYSYNTIIRAFSDSNQPLEAIIIYHQMLHDRFVKPNQYTFPSVLKACSREIRIEEGKQIHCQIIKHGLNLDDFVLSNLIRMYVICGVMDDAQRLFKGSVQSKNIFGGIDKSGEGIIVIWNVMIDGYIRIGEFESARKLFDEMPQRSVVSWNGMIAAYAQNGLFKEALEVFCEMQTSDLHPNYVTLVSVLPAISRLGALDLGEWVHKYVEKNMIKVDEVLGSALIDMYSKCGSIDKALQVFDCLPHRNVVTWNAIIGGLAMHGRADDALDHFFRMEQAGVAPSDVTFISVLSVCSHAGLVDEGRSHFKNMVRVNGLRPRVEHYGCMVDLFGRAGLLKEAEELVLNTPMKPDDVIWKALLSACRLHGDTEMGERVARRLMDLAPHDSGSYVLLSNLYASLGNWEDVAKVRLMMKEMDIRKDPGCSLIAIDGMIHEFLVQDESHPRAKEIHSMLEEMAVRLRSTGYMPDTTQVLLNIDEEEKESALYYHSEKIAIAFGLISTNPSATLQVVKNLRVCADCHSSIKLISKIYDRRIILRDRNRFHHFEKGSCSCMDYW